MKWHPDKHKQDNNSSHKISHQSTDEEETWNDPLSPAKTGSRLHHKHSVDDSFFNRSSSFLSRTTSRRSHTPTPQQMRSNNNGSTRRRMVDSLKRSTSRKIATTSSPRESTSPRKGTLNKLMSQNNLNASADDLTRSTSHRSTTPIIFSQSKTRRKPQHVEKTLECSLEELCFGAVKKVRITRDVISDAGIIVQEEEMLQINVKPGWRKGTTIRFEGKGDEKPGYQPADIVFLIEEKMHPLYKRVGDDLELGVEVPLLKALVGCNITLPLLGGEKMVLRIDDVIHPGYEKVILNQGMPKYKEEAQRGDLRLKFIVNFPLKLCEDKRSKICNILKNSY